MLRPDDLVRSGHVMVALLAGPSAGFILEVFVVDGTPILGCNFGLVRVWPEFFMFTFGRLFGRTFGDRVFHASEAARRPDPCTRLRYSHIDATKVARVGLRIVRQRVLGPKLMSYRID